MGIVKLLSNALAVDLRLNYTAAIVGVTVLLYCGPLWGYSPDIFPEVHPVLSSGHSKDSLLPPQFIAKKDKKRGKADLVRRISNNGRSYPLPTRKKCGKNIRSGNRCHRSKNKFFASA
jgi:hypothetical protein